MTTDRLNWNTSAVLALVAILGLVLSGCTAVAPQPEPTVGKATAAPAAQSGFFVNHLTGKCIDVKGSPATSNGAALQLWSCEYHQDPTTIDQMWEIAGDGYIRNALSQQCIDVQGTPGTENGAPLQLGECEFGADPAQTDQRWEITANGFVRNALSKKCIDVEGVPGIENGASLQLWDCEASGYSPDWALTDQRWLLTREPFDAVFIQNYLSLRCIDVKGSPGTANNTPLQLWDCESSDKGPDLDTDQLWQYTMAGFIQNPISGKCIDVTDGPNQSGEATLQLADCEFSGRSPSATPTDQRWRMSSQHLIRNQLTGKCLDVRGSPSVNNGSVLQLGECEVSGRSSDNNPTDQQWETFFLSPTIELVDSGSDWVSTYAMKVPDNHVSGMLTGQLLNASLVIISTMQEWNDWVAGLQKPVPPPTDFVHDVVAITWFSFPSGGYSEVADYVIYRSRLIVNARITTPGDDCMGIQSFSYPYQTVKIPRKHFRDGIPAGADLNVDFEKGRPCPGS